MKMGVRGLVKPRGFGSGSALSSLSTTDLPPPPLPPPGETPGPSPERELSGAGRKITHRPPRGGKLEPLTTCQKGGRGVTAEPRPCRLPCR